MAPSITPAGGPSPGQGAACPAATGMTLVLLPRLSAALPLSPQLMSLPSPAWPQRDEPPPCGTGLPPASSDSDSGCALEEYPEPPVDPAPPEVGSTPALPGLPSLPALPPPRGCHPWAVPAAQHPQNEMHFSNLEQRSLIPLKICWCFPLPCNTPRSRCAPAAARRSPSLPPTGSGSAPEPSCSSCHRRTAM